MTEFVKFGDQRIDDLHTFEQFRATFLVASVLLTLNAVEFSLEVGDLVLDGISVTLLCAQLHHFLPQLVQERVLMPFRNSYGLHCLARYVPSLIDFKTVGDLPE